MESKYVRRDRYRFLGKTVRSLLTGQKVGQVFLIVRGGGCRFPTNRKPRQVNAAFTAGAVESRAKDLLEVSHSEKNKPKAASTDQSFLSTARMKLNPWVAGSKTQVRFEHRPGVNKRREHLRLKKQIRKHKNLSE